MRGRTDDLLRPRAHTSSQGPAARVARAGNDQRHAVLCAAGGRCLLACVRSNFISDSDTSDQRWIAVGRAAIRIDNRAKPKLGSRVTQPGAGCTTALACPGVRAFLRKGAVESDFCELY